MRVLTINCGSSSLKFDVLDVGASEYVRLARGVVDRFGEQAHVRIETGSEVIEQSSVVRDHTDAFKAAAKMLERTGHQMGIEVIGHRVVHGGGQFVTPVLIDDDVLAVIESVSALAPLHNAPAIAAITAARAYFGVNSRMVATFDTAFYSGLPEVAARYALPQALTAELGIRRYGFHGLAHRYMVSRYRSLHPGLAAPRLISLQLGGGCSATATLDGRPLDTSMGFTPLEGLIMGTRSGDIDPSLPLFLARRLSLSLDQVEAILNSESGLLGLSGVSADMRDLVAAEAAGNPEASLAVEAFCYRARKYVGAYLAVLNGADGLLFGGGVGEHDVEVRRRICSGLEWAGLELDSDANQAGPSEERRISSQEGGFEAWVIPVDEASVIAQDVVACLAGGYETGQ
ncbi:MAG TPA: acetate/propionate family kinase [Dehalococcoidia bacterium]|nr:acetate/propionate family kinase [Dehalococcoidia bacterium]